MKLFRASFEKINLLWASEILNISTMKRQFLLLLTGVFVSITSVFAQQQLTNSGFNTWTSAYNPDGWTTVSSGLATNAQYSSFAPNFASSAVEDQADFVEPTSAIKLTTITNPAQMFGFGGPTLPGVVGLGGLDVAAIQSGSPLMVTGVPFTAQPDTLIFAYKYTPAVPTDTGKLIIGFTNQGTAVGVLGTVSLPETNPAVDNGWVLTGLVLTSYWTGVPDTIIVQFNSGNEIGSELKVDYFTFLYAPQAATPTVSVVADQATVAESVGTTTFTATLSSAATSAITVPVTFSGTATGGGVDYSVSSSSFTFNPGDVTSVITVTVIDDIDSESAETIIATLGTPTGANIGTPSSATITITDDDATPGLPDVSIAAAASTVGEAAGSATFIATLSDVPTAAVTVPVTFSGTANDPADYTVSSNSFSFAVGVTTSTITVTIVDDLIQEASETIIATLGTPTGANIGSPSSATITITDNDVIPGLPDLTISASPVSIAENGGTSTITATLSSTASSDVTANIDFTGVAVLGTDYTVSGTSVTIPSGSLSATITVSAINDVLVEGNETIVATIGTPTGANIGTPSSTTITITDDDVAPSNPTLTITAQPTSVSEAGGTATFTAALSQAASVTVTATVNFSGTAVSGTDYTASGTTISIPAGSLSATVSVSVIDDALVEGNETVIATLANVQGADLGAPSSATLTIIDNDGSSTVPTVSLSVSNTSVSEVSGAITLTATLSQPASTQVIVGVNFAGTAVTPDDFTVTGNTFVIAPGTTSASLTITIVDDAVYEGTETIFVSINSLSGAILGQPASVSISIADNDTWTGINENETMRAINVYPNPASDVLKVAVGGTETQFVNLVDLQGRIVKQATVVSGENVLDISGINSGSYVLTFTGVKDNQFTGARPVVVAK